MKGWLLDTNVIASLVQTNGAPSVKAWAAAQDEERLWLSLLTFAEYDKGIANLRDDDPNRARYMAARDALTDPLGDENDVFSTADADAAEGEVEIVDEDEAVRGCVGENVGHLAHLEEEGRGLVLNVEVGRVDAREDAI